MIPTCSASSFERIFLLANMTSDFTIIATSLFSHEESYSSFSRNASRNTRLNTRIANLRSARERTDSLLTP